MSSTIPVTTLSTSLVCMNPSITTQRIPVMKKNFPVSGIVGILLGLLLLIVCMIKSRHLFVNMKNMCMKRHPQIGRLSIRQSFAQAMNHYRITTRMNKRRSRKYTLATIDENDGSIEEINLNNESRRDSVVIKHQLVKIEC